MENKKKTVEEFLQQGEKLMELPGSPKFLETHVNKLKEAWAVRKNISRQGNNQTSKQKKQKNQQEAIKIRKEAIKTSKKNNKNT